MGHFLNTYQNVLRQQKINAFPDEELKTVLSAVVVLLRRHNIDNQLCCHNDVNNLAVTAVDRYGFVTEVKCTRPRCQKTIDTTCYDANWTKEIINDEKKFKVGDHICWHRPYVIWHHAIVTGLHPQKVIHYARELEVTETKLSNVHCHSKCCDDKSRCRKFCGNLYRINYEDCYNAEYTVLRARKLLGEKRYDMLERNCEHFSSWCKTGSTKSSQVSVCWASFGKMAATIILRVISLVILFLIQLSHEESEEICQGNSTMISRVTKGRCVLNETVEKVLTSVYIAVVTMVFTIHLLITSGKRLAVDLNSENQCCNDDCENGLACCLCSYKNCPRCIFLRGGCCLINMMCVLVCRAFCCLFWCRHIRCSPCTCCRRPCKLVCGLFWRILFREVPGQLGTALIVGFEDEFGTAIGFQNLSAFDRTGHIIGWIILVQIVGYAVGIILGRLIDACCECCCKCCKKAKPKTTGTTDEQVMTVHNAQPENSSSIDTNDNSTTTQLDSAITQESPVPQFAVA